jgi:hypothetical protein
VNTLARFDLDDRQLVGLAVGTGAWNQFKRMADGRDGEVDGRLPPVIEQPSGTIDAVDPPVIDADADEAA